MNELAKLDRVLRTTFGFEPLFNFMDVEIPKYPPYNIVELQEPDPDVTKYAINVAVAGIDKSTIHTYVEDGFLHITHEPNRPEATRYIHNGIADRKFHLRFKLAEHIEVSSADLKDGMLTVVVEERTPEHKKRKVIEIT